MSTRSVQHTRTEFGDYQTPLGLARQVYDLLKRLGVYPVSIVEPNCGVGNFVSEARRYFDNAKFLAIGDINSEYLAKTRAMVADESWIEEYHTVPGDFFKSDWKSILHELPDPLLIIGNPPWVTTSSLGSLDSGNIPPKSNFLDMNGIEAITGSSNFDISEAMICEMVEWMSGRDATLAMLCKTSVARKVFLYCSEKRLGLRSCDIYSVSAREHFSVSVDACLLVISSDSQYNLSHCNIYDSLDRIDPVSSISYDSGGLVNDVSSYERWRHLQGRSFYRWRSGIKHDCADVMELRADSGTLWNGLGEAVALEDEYIYPMLKSSDIANSSEFRVNRWMIVPQRSVGEDTRPIQRLAPMTADYLQLHSKRLARRGSRIYRGRPPFSIFGVGEYSFAPWKVAISGLYKKLEFRVVGCLDDKPIVLDDTCYFLACHTESEAVLLAKLLNSDVAKQFYSAFIFWESKRPITVSTLSKLNIEALAQELGEYHRLREFLPNNHQIAFNFS